MKHLNLLWLLMLFSCSSIEEADSEKTERYGYNEKYRPQFHFSPPSAWMNDPNGLVYFDGEYHLFFQYYPDSTVWGPMHWGHAVSEDLIHWDHLPVALYPDSLGYIFSGSAVVDEKNTTGFGTLNDPAMVAIFTHHQPGEEEQQYEQYQSLAYSLDKGRTWQKFDGNPVLKSANGTKDFRDPRVFWYDEGQEWIMILAVKDQVELYSSPDLKDWTYQSAFGQGVGAHNGVWECPDLFPITITTDDSADPETKWVMLVSINPGGLHKGSGTQYFVGDFDGKTFVSDFDSADVRWLDYGADNYAGVTWAGIQDGRRLFIGWMNNWEYGQQVPTEGWRGAMTLPRELKLIRDTQRQWILMSTPVKELNALNERTTRITRQLMTGLSGFSEYVNTGLYRITLDLIKVQENHDFVITLSNRQSERVNFGYRPNKGVFFFDRLSAGLDDFNSSFGVEHQIPFHQFSDTLSLDIFVDFSSIEIFINNGKYVMTELLFPATPYQFFTIDAKNQALLLNGNITELKSIW